MIPRVVEVKPLQGRCLWLRFHDGKVGTIELINELWGPMFEPLKDPDLFLQAKVDPELETVIWPNGADLAPEFLYQGTQHDNSLDEPQTALHRALAFGEFTSAKSSKVN
jgi:hypothetical protein